MTGSSFRKFIVASFLYDAALRLQSAPCVHAYRASFAPRFGNRNSCSIDRGNWCALTSYGRKPRENRMQSPLVQEDKNGDALSTDNENVTQENAPSLASVPLNKASTASSSKSGITTLKSSRQLPTNWLGEKNYILFTAVLIGLFTGINIAVFKSAVEFLREVLYGDGIQLQALSPFLWKSGGEEILTFSMKLSEIIPLSAIPALGGLFVGMLLRFGGEMPPGLRDAVKEGTIYR